MADVHGLRVFNAVAEKMSLTRAGEAVGLTQSAVSHQLAKLEAEFRVKLLERHGRTISLTPAGAELRRYGTEIIQRVDALAGLMRSAADPGRGTLRIGATVTACQYLLPDPIRELRECFPGYAVNVLPGDSPVICPWLASGHVDIGIVVRGEHTARLPTRKLFSDQLGLVCHPRHTFAAADKVTAGQLTDQQWIMYNPASATFGVVERHLTKLRVQLGSPIELGSVEAIKELVKVGLGISVLAKWVVRNELAEGSLLWRPLPGPKLLRDWVIALPPHRSVRMVEESAAEFCRTAAQGLASG
ncbi:MAG: transcriptional regulator, LysR family [Phycisphaerales bacterium]|nr:transcriptional regulator, LysR family [Phycisphaerales bacterium]